jgi:hypothetical protein
MAHNTHRSPHHHESILAVVREEIDIGIAGSRDPANANLPELASRTTTIYSPWYMRSCSYCKHKFRDGDLVRLCPACTRGYHDDEQYRLFCWQKRFSDGAVCRVERYDPIAEVMEVGCSYRWSGTFPDSPKPTSKLKRRRIVRISSQFLRGIEKVWKPYGHEPVFEVDDDSAIIGFSCQWCRSQIRGGDRVVRCPCGKCSGHFHNDIYRHLTCWNDWNGSRGHGYCPVTGERIGNPTTALEN